MKVITLSSTSGSTINVTRRQERMMDAGQVYPIRDRIGNEYCQVQHGLHLGTPTWTDKEFIAQFGR